MVLVPFQDAAIGKPLCQRASYSFAEVQSCVWKAMFMDEAIPLTPKLIASPPPGGSLSPRRERRSRMRDSIRLATCPENRLDASFANGKSSTVIPHWITSEESQQLQVSQEVRLPSCQTR